MNEDEIKAQLRDFWLPHIGAGPAEQLVALLRPSFEFSDATESEATGHCRFGGPAMLEPGTAWPRYENLPLSLFAVIDTDALATSFGPIAPEGTGLLNVFCIDSDSQLQPDDAWDLYLQLRPELTDHATIAVIPARPETAVPVPPPLLATKFAPSPWRATAKLLLPDTFSFSHVFNVVKRNPEDEEPDFDLHAEIQEVMAVDEEWQHNPCIDHTAADTAFGWPIYPTGNEPLMPDDDYDEPLRYRQLLQLTGNDQWKIGGDGGWLYIMIPDAALQSGDFSQAFPAPGHW